MTAEIAILNREAVALAADSAVTISGADGQKIFTTANKIFQLSKTKPIGVMINGASEINAVGWETIIKRYRDQLGDRSFGTLDEYVADFLAFLRDQQPRLFPPDLQADYFSGAVHSYLHVIKDEIDHHVEDRIQAGGGVTPPEVDAIVRDVILENYDFIMAGEALPDLPNGYMRLLRSRYGKAMEAHIDQVMSGHKLEAQLRRRLRTLLLNLFTRHVDELRAASLSGMVFAGFGDDEVFPHLRELGFEGVVGDHVKYHLETKVDIATVGTRALIVPFAQREMVYQFMEGVDRYYQDVVENMVEGVLNEYPEVIVSAIPGVTAKQRSTLLKRAARARDATMETIRSRLAQVREQYFWSPIAKLVNNLPKEELAAMAEALVNLTSFKRRVSWDAETVGGPIDVAVISRGDGFIWIKRKHYFAPELNPAFMANRYGGSR